MLFNLFSMFCECYFNSFYFASKYLILWSIQYYKELVGWKLIKQFVNEGNGGSILGYPMNIVYIYLFSYKVIASELISCVLRPQVHRCLIFIDINVITHILVYIYSYVHRMPCTCVYVSRFFHFFTLSFSLWLCNMCILSCIYTMFLR